MHIHRRVRIWLPQLNVFLQRLAGKVRECGRRRYAVTGVAPSAKIDLPVTREPAGTKYGGIECSSELGPFTDQMFAPRPVTFFTSDAHHKPALEVSIGRRL
jgi:hypothetical protein